MPDFSTDRHLLDRLIFGTASLTSHRSFGRAITLLNKAFDAGISHVDTAAVYGKGYSEMIVGKFIKDKRDKVLVTTKFGLGTTGIPSLSPYFALPLNYLSKKIKGSPVFSSGTPEQPPYTKRIVTKEEVSANLEGSLKRLQTDYIDFYLLHEGVPSFLAGDAMEYLSQQRERGIVRFIGTAANRHNTSLIKPEETKTWDVLQYDAPERQPLPFTGANHIKHFLHSVLSNRDVPDTIGSEEMHGFILAACLKNNPNGKIIFTTRSEQRLDSNISNFLKFSNQR